MNLKYVETVFFIQDFPSNVAATLLFIFWRDTLFKLGVSDLILTDMF